MCGLNIYVLLLLLLLVLLVYVSTCVVGLAANGLLRCHYQRNNSTHYDEGSYLLIFVFNFW